MKDVDYSKKENMLTRAKSIREKCLDCMCGNAAEVRRCPIKTCPLFPYRMGYGPRDSRYKDATSD